MSTAILDGIATILWASAWADHVEECGCQSLTGCEITEVMPPTPQEAHDKAREIAALYGNVDALYAEAMALGDTGSEERFGNCLAYNAKGDGVAWSDDSGNNWVAPYVHDHCATWELQQLAQDQCGCMDRVVHVVSRDEWIDEDGDTHSEGGPGRVQSISLVVYCDDYRHAEGFANHHKTIDGSSWETARDLGGLVYTSTYNHPGLIDDLRAEGYNLDLSVYA